MGNDSPDYFSPNLHFSVRIKNPKFKLRSEKGLLNTLQSEIVVVGGTDDDDARLNSVEIFNVDTGVWREGELGGVFEYPINGDLGNMFNVELYTV